MIQQQKEFIKVLGSIDYHQQASRVFDDFLTMASSCFRNSFQKRASPEYQEVEEEYLRVAKKYSRAQLDSFSRLLALTIDGIGHPKGFCDFLGEVYMGSEMGNDRMGQFFTPYSVSLLTAQTTVGPGPVKEGILTALEPACGSGGLVLALAETLANAGVDYQNWLYVEATDLDERCFRMAYIQLTLAGIPALVRQGNSLSGEVFRAWPTVGMVTSFMDQRIRRHWAAVRNDESPSPTPPATPVASGQLEMSFF